MKKLICLAFSTCLGILWANAQQGQVLKPKYLPGHEYKATNKVTIKAVVSVEGNQEIIDNLKAKGFIQPLNFNYTTDIVGNVTTAPANRDKTFKVSASFKATNPVATINGKEFPPAGDMFNKDVWLVGRMNGDGVFIKTDSVSGTKGDTLNVYLSELYLNPAIKTLKFPDKAMMPGDTIVQKIDFDSPLDNKEYVNIQIPVTYKLVSIADGKAKFDAASTVDIEFKTGTAMINITGSGLGELIYDIKQQFPMAKDMKFDLKLSITANEVKINGPATMTSQYRATIN